MNMSLDIASRHGNTGTDELVPSRYSLRVGEIDVLMISDGVFPLPAATLATNADPAELAAWLGDRLQPPDVYKWPLNVVVVRSGGRTVLIDAGMGAEYPDVPRAGGLLAPRLDAAGIDPASVTDVVLTHMHVDHFGGLLAHGGLKGRLGPDVPIHLAAKVEFWQRALFNGNTGRPAGIDRNATDSSAAGVAVGKRLRPLQQSSLGLHHRDRSFNRGVPVRSIGYWANDTWRLNQPRALSSRHRNRCSYRLYRWA